MHIKRSIISLFIIFYLAFQSNITAFAAGNCAFSVGTDYGSGEINTSNDATNACNLYHTAGYNSYYSIVPTISIMRGSFLNGIKRMRSDILLFSGHGNYTNVCFNYKGKGGQYKTGVYYREDWSSPDSGYTYVGLHRNMNSVKLATFAACKTASNNGNNIVANAIYYGAQTSVGWSTTVNAGSHSKWLTRYNNKLASGATVSDAILYASSFFYLDNKVHNVVLYGNANQVIKHTKMLNQISEELSLKKITVSNDSNVIQNDEINIKSIANMIRKSNSQFVLSNYKITVYPIYDGCYVVDFTRIINEVETNSGYKAMIVNNKVSSIIDHTKKIDKQDEEKIISSVNFHKKYKRTAYDKAKKETEKTKLKAVNNQDSKFYYDIEKKEVSLIIFSDYYFDGTDAMGSDMFIEKIEEEKK